MCGKSSDVLTLLDHSRGQELWGMRSPFFGVWANLPLTFYHIYVSVIDLSFCKYHKICLY